MCQSPIERTTFRMRQVFIELNMVPHTAGMLMKEKVYIIGAAEKNDDGFLCRRLERFLLEQDMLGFVKEKDMVAVKTHFGESPDLGFVRPLYFSMLAKNIKSKKAMPFLTETSTLYKGNRTNAVIHTEHAIKQGFGYEHTGMPIIMADGLMGDDEIEVKIKGKIYEKVKIAALIAKVQSMVVVSHFTGHLGAGFGGALKNMGMGCSSRRGKMEQHSTAKPSIKVSSCTKCNQCVVWCPTGAVSMGDDSAVIDHDVCIGCGQCLAVCRFDAVSYNWGATYENLQKKVVEHAMGVAAVHGNSSLYINFLTRVSKDCDCMPGSFKEIVPDIGVLISRDPVAVDAASLDLVEERSGSKMSELCYDIPYHCQIDYARELGFGSPDYELVMV